MKYAWNESRNTYTEEFETLTGWHRWRIVRFLDLVWCNYRYGCPTNNYVSFQFYRLNSCTRNSFYTFRRRIKLIQKRFDFPTYNLFKSKNRFNELFKDFIHRKWLYIDGSTTEDQITSFLDKHETAILKPVDESCGKGITKIHKEDKDGIADILENVRNGHFFMLEEVVENCDELKRINPSSLNTLRVNTFIDKKGTIHLLDSAIRVGSGSSVVDNLYNGGVIYPISQQGFISNYGQNHKCEKFYNHPSTGVKMIGMDIPRFDMLRDYILKVAAVCPKARLVGWDVAITPSGFELIEGNMGSSEDALQTDFVGKYQFIINNW